MTNTPQRRHQSVKIIGILLSCVVVIPVLLALIMPMLGPFPFGRRSRIPLSTKAAAEIAQFEQALMTFRAEFGTVPPSRVKLSEYEGWDPYSRSAIRRIWPQFDFEHNRDLNNDGDTDDVHELTGAECLVFFLGGLRSKNGTHLGFSKNSLRPFDSAEANRTGLFFEFDAERLTDLDGDGFDEFGDTITGTPYLYAAKPGDQFSDADLAVYAADDDRNMQHVYTPIGRHDDFQIISAGEDGKYGIGGEYLGQEGDFPADRRNEEDNITNFSRGTLH